MRQRHSAKSPAAHCKLTGWRKNTPHGTYIYIYMSCHVFGWWQSHQMTDVMDHCSSTKVPTVNRQWKPCQLAAAVSTATLCCTDSIRQAKNFSNSWHEHSFHVTFNTLRNNRYFFLYIYHKSLIQSKVTFFFKSGPEDQIKKFSNYCIIKCVKTKRVLKGNSASSIFHSCNAKTQICVTGPQCVNWTVQTLHRR
jgi:hypothetical protein